MFALENAATELVERLVEGIIRNGDEMHGWEISALHKEAKEKADAFVKAIRKTIDDEIAAANEE